jgi:hypothetical protein
VLAPMEDPDFASWRTELKKAKTLERFAALVAGLE